MRFRGKAIVLQLGSNMLPNDFRSRQIRRSTTKCSLNSTLTITADYINMTQVKLATAHHVYHIAANSAKKIPARPEVYAYIIVGAL